MMKRLWPLLILGITIAITDQLTKAAIQTNLYPGQLIEIIPGFFNISYVKNTGSAFGFLAGSEGLLRSISLLWLPVGVCFWVFVLLIKSLNAIFLQPLAYTLILAGAVGNLIDRFTLGYVVDFFDFYWSDHHFANFNIADSAISIAFVLLLIDAFIEYKNSKKIKKTETA